ncbi:secreted protein [Streptantibioticus cattleyicolor NRRL 8057 = DSM 46488]|uniref:Secreted protein n=1 Tax=Streptantibioticus cattleyicolor (strain ATCC 35852 / DSM 46488 / JCM 4925 / NBRC 14057 / NRRL 8057) TaxID=1003195 RepID=G8WRV7_STREN|nr:secreted protein [Streptantibioticus cattleyicolor NRRL 8057 = DSM 46488]
MAPKALDARGIAALAANPGCGRRALVDTAGVDKAALARALGSPASFGQSRFAFGRGHAFEAGVKADGCRELLRLLGERLGAPETGPDGVRLPDLAAPGPAGRAERTRLALREATEAAGADGSWSVLDHPLLPLDVAGATAYVEPDAVVVAPDGRWTVVEIKSFPILDGTADPAKVGAAARQAAVYVAALERLDAAAPRTDALLVCPKDFSNLPTAELVDVRRQLAVTRRQLARMTRIEDITARLPRGATLDVRLPAPRLAAALDAVPAAYAPECLASCELAFHCRAQARSAGSVTVLGRSVRGELGSIETVPDLLAAAHGRHGDPADPAVAALRRAAELRALALGEEGPA